MGAILKFGCSTGRGVQLVGSVQYSMQLRLLVDSVMRTEHRIGVAFRRQVLADGCQDKKMSTPKSSSTPTAIFLVFIACT